MMMNHGQGIRSRLPSIVDVIRNQLLERTSDVAAIKVSSRHKSSYIHHVGSQPLQYVTMGQALERSANTWPHRPAVIASEEGKTLLYSELLTQSDRLGAAFLKIGLEPGDRVGIWSPNSTQWLISMMAIARAGLISVAINPSYGGSEIAYCLQKVGVKALVVQERVKQRDYYRLLADLLPGLAASAPGHLSDQNFPDLESIVLVTDNDLPGVYTFDKLLSSVDSVAAGEVGRKQHLVSPDGGCNVQFTSGTTGKPKAPLLSHHNMTNNGYFSGIRNELDRGHSKICAQVPLFHVFGSVAGISGGIQHGATLVLPSPIYSPSANVRALAEEKCTNIFGTPTMYVDLVNTLEKSGTGACSARVATTGGSLVSPQLIRDMGRVLSVEAVKSIYGMTESTAVSFQSLPGEDIDLAAHSVGHVQDHLEVKVCDSNGQMVEFGTPGELHVRGYVNMLGYWGDDEKTKEVISADGWARSGDLVVLQENGYCNIVGRLKDIIIRGGENIAPREIEDVISAHPDVMECHNCSVDYKGVFREIMAGLVKANRRRGNEVFPVSDARLGEEICAAVRVREGASVSPQELSRHCSEQLAKYKLPRHIKRVHSFPKTTSGKVQKFKLREMAERGEI